MIHLNAMLNLKFEVALRVICQRQRRFDKPISALCACAARRRRFFKMARREDRYSYRGKSFHREGGGGGRGGRFGFRQRREEGKDDVPLVPLDDVSLAVLQKFEAFQQELDHRYDKYERVVKKGRDITIESKRIIFLLHRVVRNEDNVDVLKEAEKRLNDLRECNFVAIAEELANEDAYMFLRAYSPGLQEYVEAITYFSYLKDGRLLSLEELQEKFVFPQKKTLEKDGGGPDTSSQPLSLYIPPSEYMLGLADLTGELMRKCINSICAGDVQTPFVLRTVMRHVWEGFLLIGYSGPKEIRNKMNVMQQSMNKVETACYAVQVRQTEFPEYKLTDVLLINQCGEGRDKDEDYYSDY